MFKTFIRPKLEFASSVWNPTEIGLIKNIEKVQRRYSKKLYSDNDKRGYVKRCVELEIRPLIVRRLFGDLVIIYKLIHGLFLHIDSSSFFSFATQSGRGHKYRIFRDHIKSKQRSNFLHYRVINLWNNLSVIVAEAPNVIAFKSSLNGEIKVIYDFVDNKYSALFD